MKRGDEVKVLRKVTCCKVAGADGIAAEFIKKRGDCVVSWLVGIFTVCVAHGEIPDD